MFDEVRVEARRNPLDTINSERAGGWGGFVVGPGDGELAKSPEEEENAGRGWIESQ